MKGLASYHQTRAAARTLAETRCLPWRWMTAGHQAEICVVYHGHRIPGFLHQFAPWGYVEKCFLGSHGCVLSEQVVAGY